MRLFNAVVHPGNTMTIYPEELIDHVREAVENNPEIKIWNLSLGTTMESELDEFSEFGMALDNIQDENNVLIIKSAGNCNNFAKGLPKSRISKTADSVRSLVVASVVHLMCILQSQEMQYQFHLGQILLMISWVHKEQLLKHW